jgi:hypothetical protein
VIVNFTVEKKSYGTFYVFALLDPDQADKISGSITLVPGMVLTMYPYSFFRDLLMITRG